MTTEVMYVGKRILYFIIVFTSFFVLVSCKTPQVVNVYEPGSNITEEISFNTYSVDVEEKLFVYELIIALTDSSRLQNIISVSSIEIVVGDIVVGFGKTLEGTLLYGINYYYIIDDVKIEEIDEMIFDPNSSYNFEIVLVFSELFKNENISFPSLTEQAIYIEIYGTLTALVNR